MKVSVIIPAYNAKETIDETLSSLEAQTFRDFEIVFVDDGSVDGTADYVSQNYPDVRVFVQENAGPAAARNQGVTRSKGEWLAFLDADDAWLPWRLQMQMHFAKIHPEVRMFCGLTTDLVLPVEAPTLAKQEQLTFIEFLNIGDFAFSNPVATTSVLLKRSAFEVCGGFDTQFRGPEDYDLWMRVATHTVIGKILYPLSRYRDEPGSLSRRYQSFVPEVMRLMGKAYGPDGVLHGHGSIGRARATQYVGGSWMAVESGEQFAALRLLLSSFRACPMPLIIPGKPKYLRVALLMRILKGLL